MRSLKFTESQLRALGFQPVTDGGTFYFQFLFDKNNPADSDFIATEDADHDSFLIDIDQNEAKYEVLNPENKKPMTLGQLERYISAK